MRLRILALAVAALMIAVAPAVGQPPQEGANPFLGSRPQGAPTAQPVALSLMDAINRGMQYNLGLLLQEEAVESARGARWRALSDLLPSVTGAFGAEREIINLEAFGLHADPSLVGPFNLVDVRVYLSQPLVDLHALNNARAASANQRAAAHGIRTARDLVTLVAVNLYLQTIAASSRVEATHAQLQTAEALHRQSADMKNAGIVAGIDVLRAQVQVQTQQEYINVLGAHVDPYSPTAQHALESARQGFLASGADPVTAAERAYAAVFGAVQRQASMVSFVDMFRMLGAIFLLLLPLIFLMRRPRGHSPVTAH